MDRSIYQIFVNKVNIIYGEHIYLFQVYYETGNRTDDILIQNYREI